MIHKMKIRKVIAVDPGKLAHRVTNLPSVTHVASAMTEVDWEINQLFDDGDKVAFSVLVCDASYLWAELLDPLIEITDKTRWSLPAVVVLTFKLPYRTAGSIQRHVDSIKEMLPDYVKRLSLSMFEKETRTRFRLLHLMANAIGERTVVVVFED